MKKHASVKKIQRLVQAQAILENVAQSRVADLSTQLEQLEASLEKSQLAVSNSNSSSIFTDLYIRHMDGAMKECSATRLELEAARSELQTQKVRSQKLDERLSGARRISARQNDEAALLEQQDRPPFSNL